LVALKGAVAVVGWLVGHVLGAISAKMEYLGPIPHSYAFHLTLVVAVLTEPITAALFAIDL